MNSIIENSNIGTYYIYQQFHDHATHVDSFYIAYLPFHVDPYHVCKIMVFNNIYPLLEITRMTKLVLSGDMPKNLGEYYKHGQNNREAIEDEKRKGSAIRTHLEDGLRLSSQGNHSLDDTLKQEINDIE